MEATDLQLITGTKIFSSKSARTLIVDLLLSMSTFQLKRYAQGDY
jgi:hypothetical protein